MSLTENDVGSMQEACRYVLYRAFIELELLDIC